MRQLVHTTQPFVCEATRETACTYHATLCLWSNSWVSLYIPRNPLFVKSLVRHLVHTTQPFVYEATRETACTYHATLCLWSNLWDSLYIPHNPLFVIQEKYKKKASVFILTCRTFFHYIFWHKHFKFLPTFDFCWNENDAQNVFEVNPNFISLFELAENWAYW